MVILQERLVYFKFTWLYVYVLYKYEFELIFNRFLLLCICILKDERFFWDGKKQIDYILAYSDELDSDKVLKRRVFEENMVKEGFVLEYEDKKVWTGSIQLSQYKRVIVSTSTHEALAFTVCNLLRVCEAVFYTCWNAYAVTSIWQDR